MKKKPIYSFFKRLFDLFTSFIFILIFLPFFIIIGLLVCLTSPGAPFFVQNRVGKNGKLFKMVKFRTMIKDAEKQLEPLLALNESDGPTFKIKDDPRITKFGRFLRVTSIDELPQIFNIFIGNMSFVGPRPALPYEVKKYDDFARNRLLVKPGLTCIWQCSGRSRIGFEEWMKMDNEYIQKRSLWFDLKIILKTIPAVIKKDGAE